jgi:hypothetical protein
MRVLAALISVVGIGALAAGCSSGISSSDAATRCQQEQLSKSACFDANVLANCESCYTRCGDDCTPQGTCPSSYLCPGDAPIDAGSL